jgi:transglutaminase-like putative cysteine protease
MNYDVRLRLSYDYHAPVTGGRHLVRVMPPTIAGVQRVAAALRFDPPPAERSDRRDFFGNAVSHVRYEAPHASLAVELAARVSVERAAGMLDVSPDLAGLARELDAVRSLDPDAPHHFRAASPRAPLDPAITRYAAESLGAGRSVLAVAEDLCRRIHGEFAYDTGATEVDTPAAEAFTLRRGVCQDFSHVMIAGLRGLGIPAGYVSGFLRTIPPPGGQRLVGADAMHAWVRVWCGIEAGWQELDPTNGVRAGNDHIVVGYGRDYGDVSPIVGIVRTSGRHSAAQAVDVIALG